MDKKYLFVEPESHPMTADNVLDMICYVTRCDEACPFWSSEFGSNFCDYDKGIQTLLEQGIIKEVKEN